MEKTTKKKKKTKGMKKRIGIIAVGGLSLVLTICLSVGATLAWFAGSTWSSNQLYMGGPVYVEMAGRGAAGGTAATPTDDSQADWVGGAGNLDIKAATTRTTGTATGNYDTGETGLDGSKGIPTNILLPGQKFEIYSQARVFSTIYTDSVGINEVPSTSSGANVTNTEKGTATHITDKGRVTSTTTSVLRARFSVKVEFDPTVGFNNFTGTSYANNYPKRSTAYAGDAGTDATTAWVDALGKAAYKNTAAAGQTAAYPEGSRRDAVAATDSNGPTFTNALSGADLEAVKAGTVKSVYAWKFVSSDVYYNTTLTATAGAVNGNPSEATDMTTDAAGATGIAKTYSYLQMKAPFDGSVKTGKNGFYGVWILTTEGAPTDKKVIQESESFYNARCNSYIDSYVEEYITEYGETKTRTIGESLASLENSLNQSFINLVNDSSDHIIDGDVNGMTVSEGVITYPTEGKKPTNATWLYIDPKIGNDTNTNELSTSTGGWWYLVASDNTKLTGAGNGANKVYITTDDDDVTDQVNTIFDGTKSGASGAAGTTAGTDYFVRTADTGDYGPSDNTRLDAKLFEINPLKVLGEEALASNKTTNDVKKVVSYSFPFVNGTSALPGDSLTNVFANAKITIQISFQALQAFFPYSANIDNMEYTNKLLGTAKALSIRNAIPIYNEAFDYQEAVSVDSLTGL